jgi:fluoride ion exporter CrcB/FEX
MLVMLDGSYTVLGSQVAPALTGYLLGMGCAVASFMLGRHVHDWMRTGQLITVSDEPDSVLLADEESIEVQQQENERKRSAGLLLEQTPIWKRLLEGCLGIRYGPLLCCLGLIVAFVVGDVVENNPFYRKMWLSCLFAPPGALLRWTLSKWNSNVSRSSTWYWVPRGTLGCNLLAALFSAAVAAVDTVLFANGRVDAGFTSQLLIAMDAGFSGSLSTVSGLVKEIFSQETPARAHAYWFGTILCAMFMGLAVYSPIVRFG